ncbi:MAG: chromosomal replication initiator protein DnaA [Alphaproteobacteria bacterium]|nr:chromosomal replication initiator protein DnaA [Alphaproteobacteria bacterium]
MAGAKADRQVEWMRIRGQLQAEYGDGIFKSWLKPMSLVDKGAQGIAIQLPTRFMRDRVQGSYGERIRMLWFEADPALSEVGFVVKPVLQGAPAQPAQRPAPAGNGSLDDFATPFQSFLTFENFITGESNALAHGLCLGVADGNVRPSGPLYLFGGVGLGKTHLMQALALRLRRDRPDRPVLYFSSDDFRQHYIDAVNAKRVAEFKSRVRSFDVLMIDDVHLLSRNSGTQDELLHTINAFASRSRLMVISGNASPVGLEGIDERIRSRLSTGVSAPILPLETDYPLRLAFLERKAFETTLPAPQEVLVFLAERIASNMRVLQGAMNRLESHYRQFGGEISVDRAEKVLVDLLPVNDRTPTVEAIKKLVCDRYNVRPAEMDSPRRARAVARPRQVAMYLAKQLTSLSLPDIGRKFGRDHSTVLYGVRKIEKLMEDDKALEEEVEALRRKLEP